jgi:hypothetical protein
MRATKVHGSSSAESAGKTPGTTYAFIKEYVNSSNVSTKDNKSY